MASGFASARPSVTVMSVDIGHLQNIAEEGSGYSLPNSIPGTPESGSKHSLNDRANGPGEGSGSTSENSTHQLINSSTE